MSVTNFDIFMVSLFLALCFATLTTIILFLRFHRSGQIMTIHDLDGLVGTVKTALKGSSPKHPEYRIHKQVRGNTSQIKYIVARRSIQRRRDLK